MGSINTKPVCMGKPAKPQARNDIKASAAAAASTSNALVLMTANKGVHKITKDAKVAKKTIAAKAVLTLVPTIPGGARKTKNKNEAVKLVNAQNTEAFIKFLFALDANDTKFFHAKDTINIVLQYLLLNELFYDITANPAQFSNFGFFNKDRKDFSRAMVVAEQVSLAASLKQIKDQVKANPKILITTFRLNYYLEGMPAPLVIEGTPEQIAIILLDFSLWSQGDHPILDAGLVNLLRTLREELLPDTLPLAEEQAAVAAPALDENAKKAMDAEQLLILSQAFDFFKTNNTEAAVQVVRDYIKKIKPEVVTNYIYFLKLLRLLGNAFKVLREKGNPYGTQGDQYCYKIIGLTIEMAFGERMRQHLKNGIGSLLYHDRATTRPINAAKSNSSFHQNPDSSSILAHSYYYDIFGRGETWGHGNTPRSGSALFFLQCDNYIDEAESFTSRYRIARLQGPDTFIDPPITSTLKLAGP